MKPKSVILSFLVTLSLFGCVTEGQDPFDDELYDPAFTDMEAEMTAMRGPEPLSVGVKASCLELVTTYEKSMSDTGLILSRERTKTALILQSRSQIKAYSLIVKAPDATTSAWNELLQGKVYTCYFNGVKLDVILRQ